MFRPARGRLDESGETFNFLIPQIAIKETTGEPGEFIERVGRRIHDRKVQWKSGGEDGKVEVKEFGGVSVRSS